MSIGAGRERITAPEGELRLLSALEALEARREGAALAADQGERALCDNACLLARALERNGEPVFSDGRAVLAGLRVEDIVRLSDQWAEFNREQNPSPVGRVEEPARLCPVCRERAERETCPVCGSPRENRGINAGFDWARYLRSKGGGGL